MGKYKFNDDIPAEEAVALIRAVERYANARCETGRISISEVFAILGIEKAGVEECMDTINTYVKFVGQI